jgi:hypothetical protein
LAVTSRRIGARSGDIERTVPFQAGVVGDTLTQVVSGLTVGDQVVVGDRR